MSCPFPLTIISFLQFTEIRDPDKFKAEYFQIKSQNCHVFIKTDARKRSQERLGGVNQFFVYFPEAVVLDSTAPHQFVIGLKIHDPKLMDTWYLRLFVNNDEVVTDILIRDKSVQTGIELVKTFSILLTEENKY